MSVSIANTATTTVADFASTPQTVSAVSIGAAASDRLVFVCISNIDSGSHSCFISSVTIGGISATKITGASLDDGLSTNEEAIWWAAVPTGTTASIVIGFSTTPTDSSLAVAVYRVVGADTSTPVAAAAKAILSSNPSNTVVVPANGALLASGGSFRVSSFPIFLGWTNATADQSITAQAAGFADVDMETALSTTSGSVTVTAAWTSGTGLLGIVAISPAPAAPALQPLFCQQLRY